MTSYLSLRPNQLNIRLSARAEFGPEVAQLLDVASGGLITKIRDGAGWITSELLASRIGDAGKFVGTARVNLAKDHLDRALNWRLSYVWPDDVDSVVARVQCDFGIVEFATRDAALACYNSLKKKRGKADVSSTLSTMIGGREIEHNAPLVNQIRATFPNACRRGGNMFSVCRKMHKGVPIVKEHGGDFDYDGYKMWGVLCADMAERFGRVDVDDLHKLYNADYAEGGKVLKRHIGVVRELGDDVLLLYDKYE